MSMLATMQAVNQAVFEALVAHERAATAYEFDHISRSIELEHNQYAKEQIEQAMKHLQKAHDEVMKYISDAS